MPLTNTAIKNAKPGPKAVKLFDGQGLYLEIAPTGGKGWRLKYRFAGKEKRISLGVYPDVGLAQARERRDEARKLLAQGIDPSAARKAEKAKLADNFEAVAREWHAKQIPAWTPDSAEQTLTRLERCIFPWLRDKSIGDVRAQDLLLCIRRIEERGSPEVARRVLAICGRIFRYAIATGRCEFDIAASLRGALGAKSKRHYAAITDPKAVGGLLRAIDAYEGSFIIRQALRLLPLVFVRPGELRAAEWSEFDLDAAEWRIPAERMKMRDEHVVPLSRQAVEMLRELHPLTGHGRYVFPNLRTATRAMSENALTGALRRLGIGKDEMTSHGFRAMASSLLHEMGWPSDVIERQLAHAERNKSKAAYCRTEHLPERRKMMQAWADHLDGLKAGGRIIPIRTSA